MLTSKKFGKLFKTRKMEINKKMEGKLRDVTLSRREYKPKSLNTKREEGPLIKLRDS